MPLDNDARRQVLLTRIALERAQWMRELDQLRQVAQPQRLVAGALKASVGDHWALRGWRRWRGQGGEARGEGRGRAETGLIERLLQAGALLRRHPALWSLLAGAGPWLGRRRWGRWAIGGLAGAGLAAAAWWTLSQRRPTDDGPDPRR
ncbi:hypothetical protein [Piscinibacter sakaiensis]|uniref:Transmembrane protein n=1 Tax=Piscinibacter sakaiensis TaxID=1547922 RepID=A0A0K8P0G7_PISS1|nr:hypothetical protein [Piscinibacter sakaiensis]GAP36044.1 hypothetical protein ISF6_1884 [Piscinibacter sakaiensis]